jgi:hypothetical protein
MTGSTRRPSPQHLAVSFIAFGAFIAWSDRE